MKHIQTIILLLILIVISVNTHIVHFESQHRQAVDYVDCVVSAGEDNCTHLKLEE